MTSKRNSVFQTGTELRGPNHPYLVEAEEARRERADRQTRRGSNKVSAEFATFGKGGN